MNESQLKEEKNAEESKIAEMSGIMWTVDEIVDWLVEGGMRAEFSLPPTNMTRFCSLPWPDLTWPALVPSQCLNSTGAAETVSQFAWVCIFFSNQNLSLIYFFYLHFPPFFLSWVCVFPFLRSARRYFNVLISYKIPKLSSIILVTILFFYPSLHLPF